MPLNHDEHVSMCDFHLVYPERPAVDIKEHELPILGHVVGEDPETNIELMKKAIKKEKIVEPTNNAATAAAGSAQQLPRVERELNMPPKKFLDPSSSQNQQTLKESHAVCKPLRVYLTRLRKDEIMKYQHVKIKANPNIVSRVKPCKIRIRKLALRYGQTVQLKQYSQPGEEHKLSIKKPLRKPTKTQQKYTVKQEKRHVHVFNVRRHVLKKWHTKVYLKCRVHGCSMAYVTFNTVRNATAHHILHHPSITYKCSRCAKIVPTPNSL